MLRIATLTSTLLLMATSLMAEQIKVGVSPGEHAEIMEEVARVAEPMGLENPRHALLRGCRHPSSQRAAARRSTGIDLIALKVGFVFSYFFIGAVSLLDTF